MFFPIL